MFLYMLVTVYKINNFDEVILYRYKLYLCKIYCKVICVNKRS